jgi:hypothetical protein
MAVIVIWLAVIVGLAGGIWICWGLKKLDDAVLRYHNRLKKTVPWD